MLEAREFMQKLGDKIDSLTTNEEIFDDKDKLRELEQLVSIYSHILTIDTQQAQMRFMEDSNNMMQNVDLSNVDFGDMVNKLMGK